jgi:uncharacterized MAPEG superfamily protein
MTTPFWCLLAAILIPYVLAGLGGAARARQFGTVDNKNPRAQAAKLEGAGARIQAAQANAWEALPVFGLSVVVAHLAGADASTATWLSLGFVGFRVLHAIFYVTNIDAARSLSFLGGFACCMGLFVASA